MVELPAPAASLLFWHTTDVSVLRQVLAPRIRASEEFRPSFRPARRGGRKRSQSIPFHAFVPYSRTGVWKAQAGMSQVPLPAT